MVQAWVHLLSLILFSKEGPEQWTGRLELPVWAPPRVPCRERVWGLPVASARATAALGLRGQREGQSKGPGASFLGHSAQTKLESTHTHTHFHNQHSIYM